MRQGKSEEASGHGQLQLLYNASCTFSLQCPYLPLQLIFDDIHHFLRKLLDVLVAQIDSDSRLKIVTDATSLGGLTLVLLDCLLHGLPGQPNNLRRRDGGGRRKTRARRHLPYASGDRRRRRDVVEAGGAGSSKSGSATALGRIPRESHRHRSRGWSLHDRGAHRNSCCSGRSKSRR